MRCFIDVDGVLADFVGAACVAHGRPNPYMDPATAAAAKGVFYFNQLWGMSEEEFWRPITRLGAAFWAELEEYADAGPLVAECERLFGPGNCYLLTSPSDDPHCDAGKRQWVSRHFPAYHRRTFVGSHKHVFSQPGHVLVDDFDENVIRFRAGGGVPVTYPRPWNREWKVYQDGSGPRAAKVTLGLIAGLLATTK